MVNIPNWYMDWVLTNALYELLICDAPIVVYNNDDKTDKGMHTSKEMKELTRKWEAKRKEQEAKGQRISLNDFIVNGVNAIKKETK